MVLDSLYTKKHINSVIEFNGTSERTALLKLKGKHSNVVLIQGYAPTTSHTDDEVDEFYSKIQDLIDNTSQRDDLFVMGDFNAKVGDLHNQYPEVVGAHSNTKHGHNARGIKLVNFCMQNQLYIINTHFKHRRKYTWSSPGDRTRNTIDYILVRNKMIRKIVDAHTLSHPDISDHTLLRCKAKVTFIHQKKKSSTVRFDVKKLNDEVTKINYQERVTDNLVKNPVTLLTSQAVHDTIKDSLVDAASDILGKPTLQDNPPWLSQETLASIKQKRQVRKDHGDRSIEYRLHKSIVKKMCRIDKEKHIENQHRELAELPLNQKYYEAIKRMKLSRQKKVKGWGIKSLINESVTLTDKDNILENWALFYEKLYHSDNQNYIPLPEPTDTPIPPVIPDELKYNINLLKSGKAPGPDVITAEMFKAGGDELQKKILELVNLIVTSRDVPEQLNIIEIITLFKKGDRLNCGNYRPISLLSHIYKLVMQIIYNRISHDLIAALPTSQAAYQPGRSTIEQIQSIQQIIEKVNEFNRTAVICFIDFTKAFDSVNQEMLWNTLHKFTNLNPAYINLIAKLYQDSKAFIRTDIGKTRCISILRGVKQGDLLSAHLFCIVLSVILEQTFEGLEYGVRIGGEVHTDKGYVDDVGLITTSVQEMNIILDRLHDTALLFGLNINITKTKIMLIGTHHLVTLPNIKGKNIEIVESFEYLGRILSNDNNDQKAVEHRIGKAWNAFSKMRSIITSKHLSMESKRKTYESYILPVLLYASETITWTTTLESKMNVFNNDIMRWMTNHRRLDKVKIVELRNKTKLEPVMNIIHRRKLTWYGHFKRSSLPIKVLVEGNIEGVRKKGRPRRRWRDDIKDWTQLSWSSINFKVKNRTEWRLISHNSF